MKNKTKRLTFDLDEKMHKKLKLYALKRNITMKSLIIMAIIKWLEFEDKYN